MNQERKKTAVGDRPKPDQQIKSEPPLRPDPPIVGKVTHYSIELVWSHVKEKLENRRVKYTLQEAEKNKNEWGNVYSGFGVTKVVEGLETSTEYSYRLCYVLPDNSRSEFSPVCNVKTTKEPVTGEMLHKAILLDRRSEVEKIIETSEGKKIIEIPDKYGNFPLMNAVNRNNIEIVELLASYGADVNAQNESGKTALMFAAFSGKQRLVKCLRDLGAKYQQCDKSGSTCMHYAVDGGSPETLQWMLEDGADVNVKDMSSGWTPLIRAASINAGRDIGEVLLKFKADINMKDAENKTALMIAIINGNQPLVELLVENGADLNFKNNYGKSAYDLAVSMDRRRVVKYIEQFFDKKGLPPPRRN